MGMEQQVNRRRWERYPFDASVRVVVDQAKVNHSAETTIVDARGVHFSEGGLCLFAAANLPVGSHIKVEFKNPHTDEPVRVRGKGPQPQRLSVRSRISFRKVRRPPATGALERRAPQWR